jgi:Matrixin
MTQRHSWAFGKCIATLRLVTFTSRMRVFTTVTLLALVPGTAHAYCALYTCREVTEAEAASDPTLEVNHCEEDAAGCNAEGYPLYWTSNCLTYGVSELNTSVLGIDGEQFDALVQEAFDVWQGVDCGNGKHPGFQVQSVGIVGSNGGFTCKAELRANLPVWSLVTRWTRSPRAMAFAGTGYDKNSGEVFDSDVDFNLAKFASEVAPENYALVLSKVALHEAGHYLGLAHSKVPNAAMEEEYGAVELVSHDLTQDDIDGICELYPPNADLKCSEPGYVEAALDAEACEDAAKAPSGAPQENGGCTIQGGPSTPFTWPWGVAWVSALVALRARNGASRRRD